MDISNEQSYPTPYANSTLLPVLLLSLAIQKHSPTTKTEFQDEYDYVIVGAGSAGSVVASRLSEEPCISVLLLEAGKPPPRLTDIPAIATSFFNTDIDWQYTTTPQRYTGAALNDRKLTWRSGKTLGGSSTIGATLYVRGNRRNYNEWAELGAKGWSYDDVLPYFKKMEDNTDPEYLENGFHASGGPVTVSRPDYTSEAKPALKDAILDLGFKFVDPNAFEQIGFYDYQATIRKGQRCGTAKAYLVPAENRTNLDILPNAMVRKILIEGKKAIGVEFDYNGSTQQVRAKREVIMSAGTVNTAQLLMLSGIGPMSELMKFKIPLVADLPVGLNLQDQPGTFVLCELNDTILPFEEEIQTEEDIQDYINNRTGSLTSAQGIQLMSLLSNPDSNDSIIPDYAIYIEDYTKLFAYQYNFNSKFLELFAQPFVNKSVLFCAPQLLHPFSIGTVSLQSDDPYDPPVIDPNTLADFRDVADLIQGLKTCLSIFRHPELQRQLGAKLIETVIPGCEDFIKDEDLYLRCFVRSAIATLNHQVGTARMGDPEDPRTVVDPQLRVKGIRNLRVVDASIMPTIPWGKTDTPTMMVAEKASDIIKKTIKCNRK